MGPRLVSRGYTATNAGMSEQQSFNGAAACEPRIREKDGDIEWTYEASMGPRLVSRGYIVCGLCLLGIRKLQWGRGL